MRWRGGGVDRTTHPLGRRWEVVGGTPYLLLVLRSGDVSRVKIRREKRLLAANMAARGSLLSSLLSSNAKRLPPCGRAGLFFVCFFFRTSNQVYTNTSFLPPNTGRLKQTLFSFLFRAAKCQIENYSQKFKKNHLLICYFKFEIFIFLFFCLKKYYSQQSDFDIVSSSFYFVSCFYFVSFVYFVSFGLSEI